MTTTAVAPAAAPATTPKAAQVEPDDFLRVMRFLDTEVLVERANEIRVLFLTILSGTNFHLEGTPGVAKSLGLDQAAKCITGAVYFKKPLNEELAPSAVLGGYDYAHFMTNGDLIRKVTGKAPSAHLIFIDEVFRANGMMLDALLPLTNVGEREAEINDKMQRTPALCFLTAANFHPDADNARAQAYLDRVTNMLWVERVKSDDSFKEIMRRHANAITAQANGTDLKRETVTVEQVQEAQRQVRLVRLTPEFLDKQAELRRNVITAGLDVSDRRWTEIGLVARANAWLAGRDFLIPEDLVVAEYAMARDRDQIPEARKLVLPFHGRFEREAEAKRQESVKAFEQVEDIRPLVEGTPPNEELDPDVLRKAINASRQVDAVKARVDAVLTEAEQEKRDAAKLRDLANELLALQMWFKQHNLPTQYDG
jgi:MoxR-like ATPase